MSDLLKSRLARHARQRRVPVLEGVHSLQHGRLKAVPATESGINRNQEAGRPRLGMGVKFFEAGTSSAAAGTRCWRWRV